MGLTNVEPYQYVRMQIVKIVYNLYIDYMQK